MSNEDIKRLPLLPLRGLTIFPYMVLHFDVGRPKSIAALEAAMVNDQEIFLSSQVDSKIDEPDQNEIYEVGTIAKIKQMLKLPGDTIRVLVEGLERGKILDYVKDEPYYEVDLITPIKYNYRDMELEMEAVARSVLSVFEKFVKLSSKVSPEILLTVTSLDDYDRLADIIAANTLVKTEDKQRVLEAFDPVDRLENLYEILTREIEILEIENKINLRVRRQIDKVQREYYLREQIKAIQKELGESDGISEEVKEYQEKIEKANLPEEALEKANKELDRLARMGQGSAEGSVIRTYLDWITDLPWDIQTDDNLDLKNAAKILDEDHYGLTKVKERVIEYLAVRQMTKSMKGPILCFVGPPGVGKTSIAKSIARSLDRKFIQMSVGGVRDEAEIRGHRRTYVGAIPGRVISSIKHAGTKNPVI